MKKRVSFIICLILSAAVLFGCGKFSKIKLAETQDYNYIITTNGGSVVQYGNFVYFINGTDGYEDEDAKQNVWGKVVKGALYRAKLEDGKQENGEWVKSTSSARELEFKYADGQDYFDKDIKIVSVERIVPKKIGTSGGQSGFYIFDDYVYYATPNNNKNKSGAVQSQEIDFMRTKLDGTKTDKILTTSGASADSPYGFYKQNGLVILTAFYDGKIVSVSCSDKTIYKPYILHSEVTSALFPQNPYYDKNNNPAAAPEDFIYFTRAVKDGDKAKTGNVVEIARPASANPKKPKDIECSQYLMDGETYTLDAVKDGLLFYTVTSGSITHIKYDNLHSHFMQNYPSYRNYVNAHPIDNGSSYGKAGQSNGDGWEQVSGTLFSGDDFSNYTSRYYFRNKSQNGLYMTQPLMLGFTSAAVFLLGESAEFRAPGVKILSSAADLQFVYENKMYFTETDGSTLYRTDIDLAYDKKSEEKETVSHADITKGSLKIDCGAGYAVYFARVDEWADAYAFFKRIDIDGQDAFFVGQRKDADIPGDDTIKEEREKRGLEN